MSIIKNITIRKVEQTEVKALQEIGKRTFAAAFAAQNNPTDMTRYLDEGFNLEKLAAELAHPEMQFYFAIVDGQIAGYLKLNRGDAQTDDKLKNAMEIERIYALPEFHGKGVGQKLYEKAQQVAIAGGFDYLWLGVWEKNPRAIRFYEKNGFVAFDNHIFQVGNDAQMDVLMKLELLR